MKIPRDKPERELVNITPLIDVVFILLVFFMLAGAIERPDPIAIEPPVSGSTDFSDADEAKDYIITLDPAGDIYVEDRQLTDERLSRQVTDLLSIQPDVLIHVKADGQTEAVRVIEIMELLRLAGAQYVVLISVGGAPQSLGEEAAP